MCSINVHSTILLSAFDSGLFIFPCPSSFTLLFLFTFLLSFFFFSPHFVFFTCIFSFLFLPCVITAIRALVATVTCWATLSLSPFFMPRFLFSLFRNLLWFRAFSCSFSELFVVRTWGARLILVSSFSPFSVIHVSLSHSNDRNDWIWVSHLFLIVNNTSFKTITGFKTLHTKRTPETPFCIPSDQKPWGIASSLFAAALAAPLLQAM